MSRGMLRKCPQVCWCQQAWKDEPELAWEEAGHLRKGALGNKGEKGWSVASWREEGGFWGGGWEVCLVGG